MCFDLFITKMALCQLMHLGTWRTVTHCWYQWASSDHFIYQGFPNSANRRGGGGRGEVGMPPLGRGSIYFTRRENFFTGWWENEQEWFWPFEPFSKLKTASFKIKISMTCVYKEHEINTKMVQEQWLQLKWGFHWVITWKLLFSGEDGGINLWWGREAG